ncbi:MAG: hypothetical protein IH984_08000 [Planctomycetes bacterium]|nr:hypothetical protein [Planctomycetota bacterium]
MNQVIVDKWVSHLRSIASPVAKQAALSTAIEALKPFALAVCNEAGGAMAAPVNLPQDDVGLWWAVVDPNVNLDSLISDPGYGPLWPQDGYKTIEVWTESELSALHALWRLARQRNSDDLIKRVSGLRQWHLQHTQPDNATNRPWALHVFLLAGTPEDQHYAETLLHNCMVMSGKPDPLSAWILLDSANELQHYFEK